jgi:lambda family phage portal protein
MGKTLKRFVDWLRRVPVIRNIFTAASMSNIYSSWLSTNYSADAELYSTLKTMRGRSRELRRNNDYMAKFVRMVQINVVGPAGIRLQSRVRQGAASDTVANTKIEAAWADWSGLGQCDTRRRHTFRDLCNIAISSVAVDGEVLIRKVKGFNNRHRYALQLIEADHLEENYNETLANGNKIKMSIEYNEWDEPVAYWIYKNHPGDTHFATATYGERMRIPAEEIIHLFLPQRPSQGRGLPWAHSAMPTVNMLNGYQEAEVTAARIAASKMGFYEKGGADQYTGDAAEDGNASPIQEVEPGIFEILPTGFKFQPFDPQHPTTQYGFFVKSVLRSIASGLGVSYNALANDLEGVNYSSIRAGLIDERDVWKNLQTWLIDHLIRPVFEDWLTMAMTTGQVTLPFSKYQQFKAADFQPRGFTWIDPLKEVNAHILATLYGFNTASNIIGEQGRDLEETYERLSEEKKMREALGLTTPDEAKILEILQKTPTEGGNNE